MQYFHFSRSAAIGRTFLISFFFFSISLFAQSNRGSLSGTVTDTSGAIVAGATVKAVETGTNTTYTAVTSEGGTYNFPQAVLGTYKVSVAATGFKSAEQTGVIVQINSATIRNVRLDVGEASETVTVVADIPAVQSSTSEISGVVTPRQVQELPLSLGGTGAFRSPEAFAFLLPGTTGPGTANSPNGIYIQKTSGGQNFGDEVLLDGTSAARPDNGSTFDETAPSVEALQEFKVTTSTPSAQYDRTTGGIRSFTTHSGTNSYHGTVFDIFRNTALDANTYFNNLNKNRCTGAECATFDTPKDIKNDYGVALGGPVIIPKLYNGKDKTFFYFAWEQLKWPRSQTTTSTLPTDQQRVGDFSQILTSNPIGTNPCTGATVFAGQIFDPASNSVSSNGTPCRSTPFPGNRIPTSRLNPVAQAALGYVPRVTSTGLQNNYNLSSAFPTENTTYTIRVDQNISERDRLFGSYSTRQNTLLTGGAPVLPYPVDPATWNQDFRTYYARLGWDHTFSPTILNHLNLGFNRTNSINNAAPVDSGVDWAAQIGLAGVRGPTFPQFNVGSNFPNIGFARGNSGISNQGNIVDNVNWVVGKHTLTIGGEYRWIQFNNLAYDSQSGIFGFSNAQTAAAPGVFAQQGGNSFASFLLGEANDASLNNFAHYPRYTSNYYGTFVQDDFRATSHLTLNLGLRWSVDTPRTEAQNFVSNFNPNIPNPGAGGRLGALEFATTCNGCNKRLADIYYKNFAPRVGFAWSPGNSGTTVLRGGYGIIYGPLSYADFGNALNAGYAAAPNPISTNNFNSAFNLAGGFPAYPAAPNLDPSIRNGQSVDYVNSGFGKPPMLQTWSLQVQQQLAKDLILSVGYVGNKSQNLRTAAGSGAYNNVPISALGLGQSLLGSNIGSASANAAGIGSPYPGYQGSVGNALRPYPQYRHVNTDCCLENDGMSTYNSLQVLLQRRFRSGLNLQVAYTWSKTITNADSILPGANAGGGLYQNPFDLKLEKSISSQDIPHTFVASFIYELPFGKGKSFLNRGGFLNVLAGGWQIGGIFRYQSGQPLPFYCAGSVSGWDNCIRFNPVAGQSLYNPARDQEGYNPLTTPYLNNGFFADPNPNPNAPVQFGQLSRVTGYRMQPFLNEDVSLIKRFTLFESINLEARAEAFNLANRHIFAQPGNLGPEPGSVSTTFGTVNGTSNAPRSVQLQLRVRF